MIEHEPSHDGGWYFACKGCGAEHRQNPAYLPRPWTTAVCRSCDAEADFRLVVHRLASMVDCSDCRRTTLLKDTVALGTAFKMALMDPDWLSSGWSHFHLAQVLVEMYARDEKEQLRLMNNLGCLAMGWYKRCGALKVGLRALEWLERALGAGL